MCHVCIVCVLTAQEELLLLLIIDCKSANNRLFSHYATKACEEKHSPLVPLFPCKMSLAAVCLVSMQLGPFPLITLPAICHQRISLYEVDFAATTLCKLYSAETGKWRKS